MKADRTSPLGKLAALWAQHPLYIHIATLFSLLVFATSAAIGWNSYLQEKQIALTGAEEVFERMERESVVELARLRAPAEMVVDWLSTAPIMAASNFESRMPTLRAMARALDRHQPLAAIYAGYANGDFFLLRALRDDADRAAVNANRDARYLLQHIEAAGAERFLTLDTRLRPLSDTTRPDFNFDPRTRPWYIEAQKTAELIHTKPFAFFTTGKVGITFARRADNGRAVAAADVRLTTISQALVRSRMSPSSLLAIVNGDGHVLGYSGSSGAATADSASPATLTDLPPVLATAATDHTKYLASRMIESGGRHWLVKVAQLSRDANANHLIVAVPRDELLTRANAQLQKGVWVTLLVILLAVPTTWLVSRHIARNLQALTRDASAIQRFDFSSNVEIHTRITEIQDLGNAMTRMKVTLRNFLDISTALANERDFDRLLARVIKEALEAAGGHGAVVYLYDENDHRLRPAAQQWQSGPALHLPEMALDDTGNPVTEALRPSAISRMHALGTQRTPGFEFLDTPFGAAPVQLMTVPLPNRVGNIIGVLCLFFPGSAAPPSAERVALMEAFAGSGAAAIDNQRLLLAQKRLLDSLIGLIARAIDAKSPYTYGHCQRVPELTKMLAQAACDAQHGPFATFQLNSEEWEALHIAGWLHDCGKVTTPEYVVDKATKLETIFDRIHLVRMRFEVLKRDAEIECLKKIAAGADAAQARAEKQALWQEFDDEYAFVAACNVGGEFMAPDKIEKLHRIAARTWLRTLDDRLGVSQEEAARNAHYPALPLPVTETLLADKAEHLIERREQERIPNDNPWGFKLNVPPYKYNRGELHNLSIARGTLTDEERYVINDHIVQTIVMLSELPFPSHLKRVPELAGGHHEKMDGTGYPKRLTRDAMSVQARVMAIADIFEALTAADRPYKKGKTLSDAVRIMHHMKKDNHIDADLFDLFLTSGVYRQFAQKYLAPEFVDDVDISVYIGMS